MQHHLHLPDALPLLPLHGLLLLLAGHLLPLLLDRLLLLRKSFSGVRRCDYVIIVITAKRVLALLALLPLLLLL